MALPVSKGLLLCCLAEAIGTFGLVFAVGGAIVINALTDGVVTQVGVGLTSGLIVAAMVYATGHLSGAHINPSVTLAFALVGRFPFRCVPLYWAAQLTGATVATLVVWALFGDVANLGATLPLDTAWQSLGLEVVLTSILMFVIMAVATDARAAGGHAAVAIGAVVALEATFAGPISGASMNPARSFGPALVSGVMAYHWVYWVGPVVGAALGALAYQAVRKATPEAVAREP
ncbi:MAG: aquaporin [Dehalococcoidia bacterium]|nr:aquaporin [Dehalococcoidia bacterium]